MRVKNVGLMHIHPQSSLGKSPNLFIQRNPGRYHEDDMNIFTLSSGGMDTAKDAPERVLLARNTLTAICTIQKWRKQPNTIACNE